MQAGALRALLIVILLGGVAAAEPWRAPLHWARERGVTLELEAGYGAGAVYGATHMGQVAGNAGTGFIANVGAGWFLEPNFAMIVRATSFTIVEPTTTTTLGMLGIAPRVAFKRFSAGTWAGYSLGLGYAYTRDRDSNDLALGAIGEIRVGYAAPSTSKNALSIVGTLTPGILSSGSVIMLGVTIMYQRS